MCRLTPPELEHHWPQMPQVCARRGLASASLAARAQCCGETSNSSACGSLPKALVVVVVVVAAEVRVVEVVVES